MSLQPQPSGQTVTSLKRQEAIAAYIFLLPTFVGFIIFVLGPMIAAFVLSFYDWNLLTDPEFAGWSNYKQLMADGRLVPIFQSTMLIAAITVVGNIVLGLVFAVLLDQQMPTILRQFFRTSFFFPFVVSVSAVALIWSFLMNKDFGLLNYYLGLFGVERIAWLNASQWTPISVSIINIWKNVGFNILVFLGGLQTISSDIYDAAEVDGANARDKFFRITLPLLSPTAFFLTVINTINAFQIFTEPFILTQGGPGDASRTIVMYIYEQGFRFFNLGYASTIALILFAIILVLTLIQFALSRRWVFYQ